MDKLETFEQFLASGTATISFWNFVLNMALTALLAILLGLLYKRFGHSLSNRGSFGKNFVMLAVTTMLIITIVKSSLALSLGLVGALSIVRFRTAIKEPEELTFLFLNIAIGLGFGANQKAITIIGFIFLALYLMLKRFWTKKDSSNEQHLILSVSTQTPEQNQMNGLVEILKANFVRVDLKRFDETANRLEASFFVEADSFEEIDRAKKALQEKYSGLTISFMDNNLNV